MSTKEDQLLALQKRIEDELVCPLKDAATNMVFGKGNPNASIVFIGEAPGEKEDEQGIPFVGRAGKELDKLLHRIGLTLDDVYICNILKYHPPKNRDPSLEEIERHTPYLIEQLKIIQPAIVATLGNYSTKFVLGGFRTSGMKTVKGISVLHGKETSDHNDLRSKRKRARHNKHEYIGCQGRDSRVKPAALKQDQYDFMTQHHKQNGKGNDQRQISDCGGPKTNPD